MVVIVGFGTDRLMSWLMRSKSFRPCILFVLLSCTLVVTADPQPRISVKTANDETNATTNLTMQVEAQQPYQRSNGQSFTPVIGIECSQHGDERVRTFFFSPGEIKTAPCEAPAGNCTDVLMKVDNGPLSPRHLIPRPDGSLAAQFFPPLLLIDGATLFVQFSPLAANGPIVSQFDIRGLRDEFNARPECMPIQPNGPRRPNSYASPTQRGGSDAQAGGDYPTSQRIQISEPCQSVAKWITQGLLAGSHWQLLRYDPALGTLVFKILSPGNLSKAEIRNYLAENAKNAHGEQLVIVLRSLVTSTLTFEGTQRSTVDSCTIACAFKFAAKSGNVLQSNGRMESEFLQALQERYEKHGLDY